MNQPYTKRRYLDALDERVLVFDGAMGTSVQKYNLTAADFGGETYWGCNDYLAIVKPDVIAEIHRSFLRVGCDVLETDTFRANRLTMREYKLHDRILEMNRAAAQLARRVADEFTDKPRFVAGSMGPSGMLPSMDDPVLSKITFAELVDVFREQAVGLIQGGVDVLLIETSQDLLEVKAAIVGVQKAFAETGQRLPLQVQVTLDTSGRMLLGTEIGAALTMLEHLPVDVLGMNCSTGPEHMRVPIQYLGEFSSRPISCIPNAGLPLNIDGQAVYPLTPEAYAHDLTEFVEKYGVSVVGGCCGTTPAHLQKLIESLGARPQHTQRPKPSPMVSSPMRAISLTQDPPPMFIGERLNSQGSKKVKELLLAEDYETLLAIAREQMESGAHTLDVCTALTERADEAEQMRKLVKRLQSGVDAPLVIDSTEPAVMQAALETTAGRCILNSINMENGRQRIDAVLPLAKTHGAAVIALTIDEIGMAKTADRKVEIAKKIFDIAVNDYGLAPEDLIYDVLTFTLATGDAEFTHSAIETIEGIRRVKQALPGVLTSLGVSNVSFGLKPAARAVINSVMLHHCVEAGLDMAIVNAKQITPYAEIPAAQRELADDLIFARKPDALAQLIAAFEGVTLASESQTDPTQEMPLPARIHWRILHRKREHIEEDIDALLAEIGGVQAETAVRVLNTVLLPAMKEVGDKFGTGELILPFVLQSAEVMKRAVAHLEQYLEKKAGTNKGVVVLATVYGDVHDIGKNLVKTILANNGYAVYDLGKQVPANVIIDKAVEYHASAIGLSALLVSTSKQMPLIVQELDKRNLQFPVLIGGAAINRAFGRRIMFVEEARPYASGVFYCKDAFEGLETMETLQNPQARGDFLGRIVAEAETEMGKRKAIAVAPNVIVRSEVAARHAPIPTPPSWGARVVKAMPLEFVFEAFDTRSLYRLSWGAKNAQGDEWETLQKTFDARLDQMKREALREKWLNPQGVYGYFPAQSDGNALIIYDPASLDAKRPRELTRFTFPRQASQEHLCLADYFASVESGMMDVAAFQVVTVGNQATARFDQLQTTNAYSDAYYTHGFAVQTTEATAEYLHQHIRKELGLAPHRGKRYSWGYPAIPDLDDHAKVFQLLPAEQELGMSLSPAYQLIPEQSTAAIIIHHPDATYFHVGGSRVDQLERELAKQN